MNVPSLKGFFVTFMCALGMCVFALTGCGGSSQVETSSFTSEVIEETGAFKGVAENAKVDDSATQENGVTLTDEDVLMISPNFTQGKAEVELTDASGNVAFAQEVKGRVLDTYEVAPGTYTVKVTITEAGTTGEIVIAANNAKEFEATTQSLEEALEENGIELSENS